MGSVITFPAKPGAETASPPASRNDPYYHFLETALTTASACGFHMPRSLDAAVDHAYHKTRHASRLAQLIHKTR